MSWKKIIKDEKTQIVAMLEEGILPGYSIRLNDEGFRNSIMVNVSKFPELKNKEFYFYALHYDANEQPYQLELDKWRPLVQSVDAAIRGLDLFLREVDRNNDFDKIDSMNSRMVLIGEKVKIDFSLGRSCDSVIESLEGDIRTEMCLSYNVSEDTPASGDSWLSIYLVANMLKDAELSKVEQMADARMIPDVLYNSMKAILNEDFDIKCYFCENLVYEEGECRNCGYIVDDPETSNLSTHEGGPSFTFAHPTGWRCPYEHGGSDFIEYEETCYEHGIEPGSGGPYYGYEANGHYMGRIDAFLHNDLLVSNPDRGDYSSVEVSSAKGVYEESDLLLDFFEDFPIEQAAGMLDMVAEELPQGGWKIDTGTFLLRYNDGVITEYNPDDEEE